MLQEGEGGGRWDGRMDGKTKKTKEDGWEGGEGRERWLVH